jgi:hypothetical protein
LLADAAGAAGDEILIDVEVARRAIQVELGGFRLVGGAAQGRRAGRIAQAGAGREDDRAVINDGVARIGIRSGDGDDGIVVVVDGILAVLDSARAGDDVAGEGVRTVAIETQRAAGEGDVAGSQGAGQAAIAHRQGAVRDGRRAVVVVVGQQI